MADGPTPFGRWERIGDEPYELDRGIPAVRYRWHAPERFGSFAVDFQCTEARPTRRFYPSEVLVALRGDGPADGYAERVCRFGIGLLPEMDAAFRGSGSGTTADPSYTDKASPPRDALEFLFALFQSRRTGHARVTRRFNRFDDFVDTSRSVHRPESLVPELDLPWPKEGRRSSGADVIRLIQERLAPPAAERPAPGPPREARLDLSPFRTPLDHLLVHGEFRETGGSEVRGFDTIVAAVAPAVVDGVDIEGDSAFLDGHRDDFRHFVTRLVGRHRADPAGFEGWLRQEREKGFVRLFPGFKQFDEADRHAARDKGRRFYRRLLWTAHEAMSRCYGAAALWMWTSFCDATAIAPSVEEQRAFRWYNAPLVCAGGLPLWFFGANVLRWVFEPFINGVWGLRPDAEFDALTTLIGLYGRLAADRRKVDADKKRSAAGADRAGPSTTGRAVQYESGADGERVRVPVRTTPPATPTGDLSHYPMLSGVPQCGCGGRLHCVRTSESGSPVPLTFDENWILVDTVCSDCEKEVTYRIANAR